MKTRVQMDFVLEHGGEGMLPSFNMLNFIEAGVKAVSRNVVTAIAPGAKLTLTVVRRPKKAKKRR